ncbi:hypothetical protein HDV57DRAFT_411634 [Trichoderma longibrachiatum]|uniref:Uncharacterized protein n=1 Tax=Trichoderma longibrachiatum ATCC 18648 TaxID=983965 RepID=A0A2T4C2I0_TRILO|nr:hypothetical protein M440DRAFT_329153 [Trichoderma longibrachiatum ATCC 18648]
MAGRLGGGRGPGQLCQHTHVSPTAGQPFSGCQHVGSIRVPRRISRVRLCGELIVLLLVASASRGDSTHARLRPRSEVAELDRTELASAMRPEPTQEDVGGSRQTRACRSAWHGWIQVSSILGPSLGAIGSSRCSSGRGRLAEDASGSPMRKNRRLFVTGIVLFAPVGVLRTQLYVSLVRAGLEAKSPGLRSSTTAATVTMTTMSMME